MGFPISFTGHPVPCGQVQQDPHLTLGHPTSSTGIPIFFMGHPAKKRLIYVIELTRSNKNKIRKI